MTCYLPQCRVGIPCPRCSHISLPSEDDSYSRIRENEWLFGDD